MSRRRGLFYKKPRHKDLAEIVTLESPRRARRAARKLKEEFEDARTRKRKVTIKRATVLAANRAKAARKRRNLSKKEKRELEEIAKIYEQTYKEMDLGGKKHGK